MTRSVKAGTTKKTGNRRVKRTVRRTIGALCMISAITVAAIPVPENEAYSGKSTQAPPAYNSTEMPILGHKTVNVNGEDIIRLDDSQSYLTMASAGFDPTRTSSVRGKTYTLNDGNGAPSLLDWQFEYISDSNGTGSAVYPNAFITNFNNTRASGEVNLSSNRLYSDYVYIELNSFAPISDAMNKPQFDRSTPNDPSYYTTVRVHLGDTDYVDTSLKKLNVEYTLTGDPFDASSPIYNNNDPVRRFYEDNFKSEWDSYVAAYDSYNKGETTTAPAAKTMSLLDLPKYQSAAEIRNYVADKLFGDGSLFGLSLVPTTKQEYDTSGNKSGTTQIYIFHSDSADAQYVPSNGDFNNILFKDGQGYLVMKFIQLIGIGEGALFNVQNITNITLGDEIQYVCDEAFNNANILTRVAFGGNVTVGNMSFYNCKALSTVELNGTRSIGKEAFANCSLLTSIDIPVNLTVVSDGAFYNCNALNSVSFLGTGGTATTIGDAAFCDLEKLSTVDFGERNIGSMGKCAFAILNSSYIDNDRLQDFAYPGQITSGDKLGEYALANRNMLKRVTLPNGLRTSGTSNPDIPDNLVAGCANLEYFKFPTAVGYQSGIEKVTYDPTMFYDVTNPDFYVWGPDKDGTGYALPRKCTWEAKMNCAASTTGGDPVTYKYYADNDTSKPETYEISDGNLIQGIDATGKLVNCTYVPGIPEANKSVPLEIPSSVAGITLNSIDSNCFGNLDSELRAKITGIKIADGNNINSIDKDAFKNFDAITYVDLGDGVRTIGETAFNGCANLKKVTLGENIEAIESGAFSDCPKLIEVHFDTPNDLTALGLEDIGSNAFSTGSNQLTFFGEIGSSYGPFKWAMQSDNFVDPDEGVRVCYKTNSPSNLTVIRDNTNGLATLVDYPHLDQLDDYAEAIGLNLDKSGNPISGYSLVDKIKNNQTLSNKEQSLYNAVKYIDIPEGIESIDVNGYINSPAPVGGYSNSKNVEVYLDPATAKDADGNASGLKYYNIYKTYGLFNGLYGDTDKTYKYIAPDVYYLNKLGTIVSEGAEPSLKYEGNESNPYGNDIVETITMQDVKYLPDLAFYNCENLYNLSLGDDMEDVGELPVADCTNLNSIACGNTDFETINGILYENTGTGKKIVECLPGRGDVVGDKSINKNTDPELTNVSEIAEGAFSNCDTINFVNLEGISDDSIPKYCFYDCDNLSKVTIPAVVGEIEDDAFGEDPGIWLSIANPNLLLSTDAFGNNLEAKDVPTLSVAEDSLVAKMSKKLGKNKVAAIIDNDPTFFVFYYCGRDRAQFGSPDKKKPGECPNGRDLNYRVKKHEELTEYADGHVNYQFAYWMNCKTGELYSNEDLQFLELTKDMMTDGDKIEFEARYDLVETTPSPDVTPDVTTTPGSTTPGSTTPGNTTNGGGSSSTKYTLTVVYGSGSGQYPADTKVVIEAIDAPTGKVFDKWIVTGAAATVYSSTSKATTVTTAAGDSIITATYKDEKTGNGSSSGGSGNGTKAGSSGTYSRTGANGSPAAGTGSSTRVDITKPGISDVDKAYASVSGSTDSFVVKITESADAANQVATALANKYGDMTPIKYFAMDISLYDATGTNKITDTTGLKVNVTMPIPDALRQYAGNNKVGAVVNGTQLEDLACKFTTVDGIPCISFTATHFSPYTIYVDTNNLQVGLMDSSPKTGDPIHPKWFITIALAATSLFLFLKKDKVVIPAKA